MTSVGKTANFSLELGPGADQRQDQQRTRPADQTSKSDQNPTRILSNFLLPVILNPNLPPEQNLKKFYVRQIAPA